jgi:hypothetical protein
MNLIDKAIDYTKEVWNKTNLALKVNNFITVETARCDTDSLNKEEFILFYLNKGDIERAYYCFVELQNYNKKKKDLEDFKKYLEEKHDN